MDGFVQSLESLVGVVIGISAVLQTCLSCHVHAKVSSLRLPAQVLPKEPNNKRGKRPVFAFVSHGIEVFQPKFRVEVFWKVDSTGD